MKKSLYTCFSWSLISGSRQIQSFRQESAASHSEYQNRTNGSSQNSKSNGFQGATVEHPRSMAIERISRHCFWLLDLHSGSVGLTSDWSLNSVQSIQMDILRTAAQQNGSQSISFSQMHGRGGFHGPVASRGRSWRSQWRNTVSEEDRVPGSGRTHHRHSHRTQIKGSTVCQSAETGSESQGGVDIRPQSDESPPQNSQCGKLQTVFGGLRLLSSLIFCPIPEQPLLMDRGPIAESRFRQWMTRWPDVNWAAPIQEEMKSCVLWSWEYPRRSFWWLGPPGHLLIPRLLLVPLSHSASQIRPLTLSVHRRSIAVDQNGFNSDWSFHRFRISKIGQSKGINSEDFGMNDSITS